MCGACMVPCAGLVETFSVQQSGHRDVFLRRRCTTWVLSVQHAWGWPGRWTGRHRQCTAPESPPHRNRSWREEWTQNYTHGLINTILCRRWCQIAFSHNPRELFRLIAFLQKAIYRMGIRSERTGCKTKPLPPVIAHSARHVPRSTSMTSTAFSSSSEEVLSRTATVEREANNKRHDLWSYYELERCVEFVARYSKVWLSNLSPTCIFYSPWLQVALQFPDHLLVDSVAVAAILERESGKAVYILGDTSYGRYCYAAGAHDPQIIKPLNYQKLINM